jgi:oligopeptide/dipeptide ABC transporter ATP-binding protein
MSALLEVTKLHKRFPVKSGKKSGLLHAVDDVNLSIGKGESVGLVGESGCGKSTLVKLITRLTDASAGSIVFEGAPIHAVLARDFARTPARARIQKVFQDPTDSLNPRFTAFEVIADPLRVVRGLSGGPLSARVEELADAVAFPRALLARFPHQLSGGQKARIGIARAIALDPALLVLDEPTAALDVSVQAVILHLLRDLKQRLGMSYLFVSHDLNVVRLLCDRVLVMYLGRIVESGPAEQVFRAPLHPYTRALVAALPIADASAEPSESRLLRGEPQSPIDPSAHVCRFVGRCPMEQPACSSKMPELTAITPTRAVACHFADGASVAAE